MTILLLYISVALQRAINSRPNETNMLLVRMNNTIKVYSSDNVLIAYVKIPELILTDSTHLIPAALVPGRLLLN